MKKLLINLGVSLASLLFCFFLIELVFAAMNLGERPAEKGPTVLVHEASPNLKLIYKPSPGVENEAYGVINRINSRGFRDREFETAKRPGWKRVIFLGDSVVFGIGLTEEETLPKQLEKQWLAQGKNIEVLNLGVSGYDTEQAVEFFKEVGLAFQPDLVIAGYTLNDILYASLGADLLHDQADYQVKVARTEWRKRFWMFLFQNSRLMRFLDEKLQLQKNYKFFRGYREKSIWHYLEDRNRLRMDPPESEYQKLGLKIREDAEKMGTRPDALQRMLGFVGIGNDPMYSSHWNVVEEALGELVKLSREHDFELAAVIFPYGVEMEHYALESVHDFLARQFRDLGFQQVVDLKDPVRQMVLQPQETGQSPFMDPIHFSAYGSARAAGYLAEHLEV